MRIKKLHKFFNLIFVIILLLTTTFSFVGCLDSGGGGGSGSGGSSSGGSSGSGSGSDSSQGDNKLAITSEKEDDFFQGVLIMYDAGFSGEFYDKATESNKTFSVLLNRQITTFTSHLIYALNVLYGDNTVFTAGSADEYNLLQNSDLADLWSGVSDLSLSVKPATLLSNSNNTAGACIINSNNFDNDKTVLASSISTVANLGDSELQYNQFNFNNAIIGGYEYEQDEGEEPKGRFTDVENTAYAWSTNISNTDNMETIRDAVANILMQGKYESGGMSTSYVECLTNIEYLGFSPNDINNISDYILNEIIGNAYSRDEDIRRDIPTDSSKIAGNQEDQDLFPEDVTLHYYRAYDFTVRLIIERMATITTSGIYSSDDTYNSDDEYMTYVIMPRTNMVIKKCSDLFGDAEYNEETGEYEYNDDFAQIDPETGEYNFKYEPILTAKLKQIVFLPKLSESVLKKYREELEEKYGSNYSAYADYRFSVQAVNMGLNGHILNEESRFICLPTFTIKAEGEIVYQDKISNDAAKDKNNPVESFHDEYSFELDPIYNAERDDASFNVQDAMKGKKFSDYNGVKVFSDNGLPNLEYFNFDTANSTINLIVNNVASLEEESDCIYAVTIKDGKFEFTFNGGDNFLQMDFSFFDLDSSDIYGEGAIKLTTQIIDLVTLAIWT